MDPAVEGGLVAAWLGRSSGAPIRDQASIINFVAELRRRPLEPLSATQSESVLTVASELGRNQLRHAGAGYLAVGVDRLAQGAASVIAIDGGPGLTGDALAPTRDASSGGLGMGLRSVRRLASRLDIDARCHEGTRLEAHVGASPSWRELGVAGRPHPEERLSGDGAWFRRGRGDTLTMAVVDGLGHGLNAQAAALEAMAALEDTPETASLEDMLAACHDRLRGTRGAAVGLVRLEEATLSHLGVGNIVVYTATRARRRWLPAAPGVVGQGTRLHLRLERAPLEADAYVVLHTDGIPRRHPTLDGLLTEVPAMRAAHPFVLAEHLVRSGARENDDALVAVVGPRVS